ncbi:unnamed protein product [Orchesella dallaii]|uniref:G-protein coupled receptors family 1 profile domain-containing protein n=1 Tax=Orchesella dallaii TaxID=48710 RepID=A0ABP1PIB0_9HEXA
MDTSISSSLYISAGINWSAIYQKDTKDHEGPDNTELILNTSPACSLTLKEIGGASSGCLEGSSLEDEFKNSSRFWVQYVFFPIVVFIGVLGNSVTIYVFTRKPMPSSTNVYLTALAVADIVYLVFSFSMSWRHFPLMNTVWLYWWYSPVGLWITDASGSASVWLTVSFTVERYIAVCHPIKRKIYCTEERALYVSVTAYMISFALTASTPFEWRAVVATNEISAGNETGVRRSRNERISLTSEEMASVLKLQASRPENRITVILIAVVILFLFCQMPTAIVLIYTSFHTPDEGSAEESILLGLGNIFNLLVAFNAASNFFLYNFCSTFRKRFCAVFSLRRRFYGAPQPPLMDN